MTQPRQNIAALLDGATSELSRACWRNWWKARQWSELNDRFLQDARLRHGRIARAHDRQDRDEGGTRNARRARPAGVPLRRHERDELLQHQPRHAGAGRLSARLVCQRGTLPGKPKIVIAHDTRFFSPEFSALTAKVAAENGAMPASSTDRARRRSCLSPCGICARAPASSSPPATTRRTTTATKSTSRRRAGGRAACQRHHREGERDRGRNLRASCDPREAKSSRSGARSMTPTCSGSKRWCSIASWSAQRKDLRIVFTPIHGTGGVIIKPMLERLGFQFQTVPEQDDSTAAFPPSLRRIPRTPRL